MFDHVTIRVDDPAASLRFYETVLPILGISKTYTNDYLAEWDDFSVAPATDDKPATRRLHLGFVASSRDLVDEFWRAGTDAGYRDDGPPGPRPQYRDDYYGAFLLDPDGNSAEAVHHEEVGKPGNIDHLWVRVADLASSRRFYELVAPHAGFRLVADLPDRARFAGRGGSFSIVDGPPAQNDHIAFPAPDNAAVDAFHAELLRAGYRDNGPPGERAVYHPGYYGAFVLDPDGNNVELVCHNR